MLRKMSIMHRGDERGIVVSGLQLKLAGLAEWVKFSLAAELAAGA
jgi:hypothetical protein